MTLALAMITLNEEKNLPILFKSIEGCFDKIYVTDTGSTDKTKEIAKDFGCQVSDFKWCDDFSKARNASFEPVKEDYIAWLDEDDELVGREAFRLWRDAEMDRASLWMIPYHYAPGTIIERERVIKNMGFKWKYFVHEGIDPCVNGKVPPCGRVHTWTVNHRRKDFSSTRNLALFEKNIHKLDARMNFYYGKELYANGQNEEAREYLMQAVMDTRLDRWEYDRCKEILNSLTKENYGANKRRESISIELA